MSEMAAKGPDPKTADQKTGDQKRAGQTILGWWSRNIGDRDQSQARALASRLRRAGPIGVLGDLFPAHAGMNRLVGLGSSWDVAVPRPRGDEPPQPDLRKAKRRCSPPTRG